MPDDHASSREPSPIGVGQQEVLARRVRVLLPLPLPEALDYLAAEGTSPPEPGSFVNVPLGQRSLTGVVWDGVGNELAEERLKPIIETLPTPPAAAGAAPLCRACRRLHDGAGRFGPAHDNERPRGIAIAAAEAALRGIPNRTAALAGATTEMRLTPARRRVLELLCGGSPMPAAEVARLAACGTGVVRDLVSCGARRGAIRLDRSTPIAAAGLAPMRSATLARSVDCGRSGSSKASRRVPFR